MLSQSLPRSLVVAYLLREYAEQEPVAFSDNKPDDRGEYQYRPQDRATSLEKFVYVLYLPEYQVNHDG